VLAALHFDGTLDWGQVAAVVAALVAVATVFFVWRQIVEARRAVQAQALLTLMLSMQTPEVVVARAKLYKLRDDGLSGKDLLAHAAEIEPAIRVLDTVGVFAKRNLLPREALLASWGGMICEVWSASEEFINARRQLHKRPDLWKEFEELANGAALR